MKTIDLIKSKIKQGSLLGRDIDPLLIQLKDLVSNKKEDPGKILMTDFEDLLLYRLLLDKLDNIEEGHINFSVKECRNYNLNFPKIKKFLEEPETNRYIEKLHQVAFGGFIVFGVLERSNLKEFLYRGINNTISRIKPEEPEEEE
ncbi:MAG: hypothetical protein V1663_01960 [archaeon]